MIESLIRVSTSYSFGIGCSTVCGMMYYIPNKSEYNSTFFSFMSGVSAFGCFVMWRRAMRRFGYQNYKFSAVTGDYELSKNEWVASVQTLYRVVQQIDFLRYQRTGFVQNHSSLSNFILLASAEIDMHKKRPHTVSDSDVTRLENFGDLEFIARYANAAYGYVFCSTMGLVSLNMTHRSIQDADRSVYYEMLGRSEEQLECVFTSQEYSKTLFSPKHYLFVDHVDRKIVLSIRGTSSISDAVSDLFVNLTLFDEYDVLAHGGILKAARSVIIESGEILMKTFDKYADYDILVTGHSLGGGVSSLVTMMLVANSKISKARIQCVAFGAPPLLSKPIFPDNILVVVNGSDIVPRLSFASANRFIMKLENLDRLVLEYTSRWHAWLPRVHFESLSESQKQAVQEAIQLDHLPYTPTAHDEVDDSSTLYHIGYCYDIVTNDLYEPSAPNLMDIKIDHFIFLKSHLPSSYQYALKEWSMEDSKTMV